MDEEMLKALAAQLRKPSEDFGLEVGNRMNEGNRLINEYAIQHLDLVPEDRVLEIGMGNGFFVSELLNAHYTISYTGCDHSELMVKESQKNNAPFAEEGRASFICANADALPFEDHTFTKVFTVNTIYFWENPDLVLSGIKRVLKPSGKLLIGVRPPEVMEILPVVKFGFKTYSDQDLVSLLEKNGFRHVSTREIQEPDQDMDGTPIRLATLLVTGEC